MQTIKHSLRLLMIILATVWSMSLSAQSLSEKDKTDISERLGEYFDYTKANDYANMMEYVYPKIFTLATKEQLIAVFNGLEAMGLRLNVDEINLKKLEPLMEGDDKTFAVAEYGIDVRLEMLTETMQSDQVIESLKASFKLSYNAEDMAYDKESKILSFSGRKYLLAVKDPEYDAEKWYFLEYDPSNPAVLQMLVSSEVLDKFLEKMK